MGAGVSVGATVGVALGMGVADGASVAVGMAVNVPATIVLATAAAVLCRSGVAAGVGACPQAVTINIKIKINPNRFIFYPF